MAYLPHIFRAHAPCAACDTITRRTRNIEDMLRRAATEWPMLVCCRQHGADYRPYSLAVSEPPA